MPKLLVFKTEAAQTPRPPTGLLKSTLKLWDAFWGSELARLLKRTDEQAVSRLFRLLDERERAWSAYRKERLLEGSKGQTVINPLGRLALKLDAEIRQIEDRFGMNPRARLNLGIAGEAVCMQDLNEGLAVDGEDPR